MIRYLRDLWPLVWKGTLRDEQRGRLRDAENHRGEMEKAEGRVTAAQSAQAHAEALARQAWRAMEIDRAIFEGRDPKPRDPIGPPGVRPTPPPAGDPLSLRIPDRH